MEKRVITFFTIMIAALSIGFTTVLLFSDNIHKNIFEASNEDISGEDIVDESEEREILLKDNDGEKYNIRLELPLNIKESNIDIKHDIMNKKMRIEISGVDNNYVKDYPLMGKNECIKSIYYNNSNNVGLLEIDFDSYYEYESVFEDRYLYIDWFVPGERYDHVVVLDAGHGGNEPGAESDGVLEKNLNLNIILKLDSILNEKGDIKVYLTRMDDSNPSLKQRVDFTNKIKADLFVSVHQNSTGSGRTSDVNGTEVMYYHGNDNSVSEEFAKKLQAELVKELGSQDRGLVPGDDILVLREAKSVAALVELGFVSNPQELLKLKDESYQQKAAEAISKVVIDFFEM